MSETSKAMMRDTAALVVNGKPACVTAEYTLRFVEHPGAPATPVLYFQGRRVTAAWSLRLEHSEAADRWGASG